MTDQAAEVSIMKDLWGYAKEFVCQCEIQLNSCKFSSVGRLHTGRVLYILSNLEQFCFKSVLCIRVPYKH